MRRLSQKWVKKALAVVEASIPAICGVPCEAGRPPRGPASLSHHDGAYDRSAGHQADRGCLFPPHMLSAGEVNPAMKYCLENFIPLSGMHTYD
ncbi:hypothetical protein [Intestinimonas butyriciproducens]|uniref:hypothetical protein n=1 Tax=Intestinimonas butyriciproducens TaxID=1297617 RepID=UPI0018AAF18D|nr:hypothetical protein [Intestinimonas butyriciproducens]